MREYRVFHSLLRKYTISFPPVSEARYWWLSPRPWLPHKWTSSERTLESTCIAAGSPHHHNFGDATADNWPHHSPWSNTECRGQPHMVVSVATLCCWHPPAVPKSSAVYRRAGTEPRTEYQPRTSTPDNHYDSANISPPTLSPDAAPQQADSWYAAPDWRGRATPWPYNGRDKRSTILSYSWACCKSRLTSCQGCSTPLQACHDSLSTAKSIWGYHRETAGRNIELPWSPWLREIQQTCHNQQVNHQDSVPFPWRMFHMFTGICCEIGWDSVTQLFNLWPGYTPKMPRSEDWSCWSRPCHIHCRGH